MLKVPGALWVVNVFQVAVGCIHWFVLPQVTFTGMVKPLMQLVKRYFTYCPFTSYSSTGICVVRRY